MLALSVAAFLTGITFVVLDRIEQRAFDALLGEAKVSGSPVQRPSAEDVLNLMHTVHNRLKGIRLPSHPTSTLNSQLNIASSYEQLTNPSGMCASYSHVLAKTLMTAGYSVRKVGLAKGEKRAIHHVIEVRVGARWILLDAVYNLAFRTRTGQLTSAAEVSQHWAQFRSQVPDNYNPDFDYQGYYYTNWDRIPLIGWMVRSSPTLARWLHAHGVSIRFWFFNTFRWEAGLSLLASATFWGVRRRLQRRAALCRGASDNLMSTLGSTKSLPCPSRSG